jgi:hypothetical protein
LSASGQLGTDRVILGQWIDLCYKSVASWPSISPDLNPIENVWAIMKRSVRKSKSISMESLRCAILRAWEKRGLSLFASASISPCTVAC